MIALATTGRILGLQMLFIAATKYQKKDKKKEVKPYVNVGAIKVWSVEDKNCPEFTSDAQLAKFATFNGQVGRTRLALCECWSHQMVKYGGQKLPRVYLRCSTGQV